MHNKYHTTGTAAAYGKTKYENEMEEHEERTEAEEMTMSLAIAGIAVGTQASTTITKNTKVTTTVVY